MKPKNYIRKPLYLLRFVNFYIINVSYLIIKSAQAQKENRGLHFSLDNVKSSSTLIK